VYATDGEYKRLDDAHLQPFVEFFSGADVLIFDAQYSLRESLIKEDWGHSSALVGIEFALRAGVKRLVLFHHDPNSSDADLTELLDKTVAYQTVHEPKAACEVSLALEDMTIELASSAPFDLYWPAPEETALLTLRDDFDQQALEQVLRRFTQESATAGLPRLVVDLSAVTRLTVTCLRALMELRRQWQDRPLALANLSPQTQHVLELTNVLDDFTRYPTVQAAQAALEAREILRLPGQRVGERYRIEARVGENDLSAVFDATDVRLGRPVSLRVLSPSLSQSHVQRLLQEARKLGRLRSPHIVALFDCGQDRGLVYLVTERVGGRTLGDLVKRKAQFSPLDIAVGILRALDVAHCNGVVHGRLTPDSVLVEGGVKLKDFGLTWIEPGRLSAESSNLIGDLHYVAPEQIKGQSVDARTDLYALGVILYELFTGHRPFEGNGQELLDQHLYQSPAPPRQFNSNLSRSLEYLILKLLAKQSDQRYATAGQVRQVLLGLETTTDVAVSGSAPHRKWALIGRDAQLCTLLAFWEMSRCGEGQFVMIAGEAGVGKTRLVEEVIAQVQGAVILVGHCSELEGSPPYQPFVEIVKSYLASTPLDDLSEQMGEAGGVLATLVPEICHLIPDVPPFLPLRIEREQPRLMSAFTRFIGRACTARPWLLVFDDLHWADEASLQLLHYLFRHLASMPLMVMGTFRDVELEPQHPLREWEQASSRYPFYHHLSLDRLDQDAVRRLLEQIWQPSVPEAWVKAIHEQTGGNPFYVQEVAKGLTEDGVATWRDGAWHFAPIGQVKPPQSVRDIVLRRVARARPATQELLRRVAVLGQMFSFADLLVVSEQTEDQVLECLDEALERYLIREMDAGTGLSFSHTEIHQVIYEDMSLVRRQALHRRTALALEQRAQRAGEAELTSEQLAHHFVQAGDHEKGLVYSLKAAEHAVAVYAYQTALTWYNQVLALLPGIPDANDPARRAQIYKGLGLTLRMLERFEPAVQAYQDMLAAAEATGDRLDQARALNGLAYVLDDQANFRAELETIERAEQLVRTVNDPIRKQDAQVLLASVLFQRGWALFQLGDSAQALALGEQALALSTEFNARPEMAECLNLIAMIFAMTGRYEQSHEYCQRALALYRELGDMWRIVTILNNLGETARLQGDYHAAIALYQEALPIAQRIGSRSAEILLPNNLGGAWLALGDYARAESYLRQVIAAADKSDVYVLSETWCFLAETCLRQGKTEEALRAAQQALALSQEIEVQEDIGGAWRVKGLIAMELEARGQKLELENQEREVEDRKSDAQRVEDHKSEAPSARRPLEASTCFAESLRIYTQLGYEGERARTLRAWALYEQQQGRQASAQKMWLEAKEIFARLKTKWDVERMAQDLLQ
jgi:tetratricopeptide (TPR) repeat protein/anti-anti-sigma regulatory factor